MFGYRGAGNGATLERDAIHFANQAKRSRSREVSSSQGGFSRPGQDAGEKALELPAVYAILIILVKEQGAAAAKKKKGKGLWQKELENRTGHSSSRLANSLFRTDGE